MRSSTHSNRAGLCNIPATLHFGFSIAIALAGVFLLVPLNMGGCGVSDVTSGVSGAARATPLGSLTGAAPAGDRGAGNASGANSALNGLHTGNSTVDQIGIGNINEAREDFTKAVFFDDQREADLGRNVALQLTTRFGVLKDDNLNRYVTFVGMTVADASPRNDFPYSFCVLATNEVNAFSGPDGFVMITRGALATMQDEAELAGVLGHEIGHVVLHHGREVVRKADLLATGQALSSRTPLVRFLLASDNLVDLVTVKGYARSAESEADAEAVRYVARAGYDPTGYLHFLQRTAATTGGQSRMFATHPGLNDRIQSVSTQIAQEGTGGKGQHLRERFSAWVRLP